MFVSKWLGGQRKVCCPSWTSWYYSICTNQNMVQCTNCDSWTCMHAGCLLYICTDKCSIAACMVYSHLVNSHIVNSHLVNIDQMGIDQIRIDKVRNWQNENWQSGNYYWQMERLRWHFMHPRLQDYSTYACANHHGMAGNSMTDIDIDDSFRYEWGYKNMPILWFYGSGDYNGSTFCRPWHWRPHTTSWIHVVRL